MGPCRLLKTIFAQFLGKYRVVSALFGKIERLTFTGTFDAFQHLVKSHSFKQICFPHRSEMGVLKSFPKYFYTAWNNLADAITEANKKAGNPDRGGVINNSWGTNTRVEDQKDTGHDGYNTGVHLNVNSAAETESVRNFVSMG